MNARQLKTKAFLSQLYRRGPFERHAFIAMPGGLAPVWEVGDWACSQRPVREFLPALLKNFHKANAFHEAVGDDSLPTMSLSTGTHLYAVCLGATPHYYPDNNPFAEPIFKTPEEADRLVLPSASGSRIVGRILEMAHLLKTELGDDFTIGPPDMQTGFDTACILWDKTNFFETLVEEPESVERLANKCADFFLDFVRLFYREFPDAAMAHCPNTWVPAGLGPWVSNDECGALSPAMFERFCLPELIRLSETFGGLGMHCCADAPHQFPLFKKIPNFYAFNRVPSIQHGGTWQKDAALGILGGENGPVFVPGWCSEETVAWLLANAPHGTRFAFHSNGFATVDEGKRWLEVCRHHEQNWRAGKMTHSEQPARAACGCCN